MGQETEVTTAHTDTLAIEGGLQCMCFVVFERIDDIAVNTFLALRFDDDCA